MAMVAVAAALLRPVRLLAVRPQVAMLVVPALPVPVVLAGTTNMSTNKSR